MKDAIEELGALAQAIVEEQREEERRLAAVIEQHSLRIRKSEGLTWSPVTVERQDFTFGGRVRLEIRKGINGGLNDAYRTGSPVHFYQADEAGQPKEAGAMRRGIVRKIRLDRMELILDGPPLSSTDMHERWTVDERSDDRTYRLMAEALSHWLNTEDRTEREFRDALLGFAPNPIPVAAEPREVIQGLNAGQSAWIHQSENCPHFSALHGPPGTGKTTTLLAFVERAVARGERILLTAPSNAAVDLLVQGCALRNLSVVRLGHPMRLDEAIMEWGLDAQVERESDFKQVKELRRRAEKEWGEANRFHRHFGAAERSSRAEHRKEARSLQAEANALEQYIAERLVRTASVVCATLAGSAEESLNGSPFDWVIVDEAAQAMQPAVWIALMRGGRAVFAGDPHQLPPVVKSEKALKLGLERSFLERILFPTHRTLHSVMLTEQYRMHPAIMEPASRAFYDGQLTAAKTDGHACVQSPFLWIDTAGCAFDESVEAGSSSTRNREEAHFVVSRIQEWIADHPLMTVGLIAPYRAQVEELETQLKAGSNPAFQRVECATVDAFQGQERDVIFISLTRSNPDGHLGFLKEYRRMNVAMTRAKHHLVIIGDGATVGQDSFYEQLLDYAQSQGGYRSAWEWMHLD